MRAPYFIERKRRRYREAARHEAEVLELRRDIRQKSARLRDEERQRAAQKLGQESPPEC